MAAPATLVSSEPPAAAGCSSAASGARLTFRDLAFAAKLPDGSQRQILEPCSGSFEPGELVAIMGPSGSGKTTLLDMLAMKKTAAYSGQVFVNGNARDQRLFPRLAAYVGQEDCMPQHWTVREALEFNANLKRRPVSAVSSRKANAEYVDGLLATFGLTEVANVYIGGPQVRGISGGQRRRVSLARGVASHASMLFCDEPTSGLSATDAEACILALHRIAKQQNVLILVNIHQPRREVAELFDTLLLLTSSPGRMVYLGPMAELRPFLDGCGFALSAQVNVADFIVDLVTPGSRRCASERLVAEFTAKRLPDVQGAVDRACAEPGSSAREMLLAGHASAAGSGARGARLGAFAVPFHVQFRMLLLRKARITLRNPVTVGLQVLVPGAVGCVVGSIFKGVGQHEFGIAQLQFFFIAITMASLQTMSLMAPFIEERRYIKLETSEKLFRDSAHVLTALFVSAPLSLLGSVLANFLILWFSGLGADVFPFVLGWCLLAFCMSDALFGCVAAVAADGEQALLLATPLLLVLMLFNGVVVTRATAPAFLGWVFEVSPTFYALQSIVVKVTEGTPSQALYMNQLGYEEGHDLLGVAVTLGLTCIFRCLQVLALTFLNNIRR